MFLNKKWAENYTIRDKTSTPSYKILTVSFRPYYLPREFGQITIILAYVPGPDNSEAAKCIADATTERLQDHRIAQSSF